MENALVMLKCGLHFRMTSLPLLLLLLVAAMTGADKGELLRGTQSNTL
jgi:hypothetical protein